MDITNKECNLTPLTINDKTVGFDQNQHDPTMPLLWFLRDYMHLTDTKYGCGIGVCGACTVMLNGKAVRACQKTIGTLQANDDISTVQSIPPAHPLKHYWKTQNIPQCGYCQTGALLACYVQRQKEKSTSLSNTLNQHLCRCGSYQRSRDIK